jgi:hypothetical protein
VRRRRLYISLTVSAFDAATMKNKFAPLWEVMAVFPGNLCAWVTNLVIAREMEVTSSAREFVLTLPFNLLWFGAWAWMANVMIDDLTDKDSCGKSGA